MSAQPVLSPVSLSGAYFVVPLADPGAPHPADIALKERRSALRLLHYWNALRGARAMPVESDLDPDDILLAPLWPDCFVVQVRDFAREQFNYTYLGAKLAEASAGDLASGEQTPVASIHASKLIGIYRQLMESKWPVVHEGEFINRLGYNVKFRQSLFPFGEGQVEMILGHVGYTVNCAQRQAGG